MCQSNVYVVEGEREQLVMKDVGWLELQDGSLQLKDVDGNERAVPAHLLYADLVMHRLVLEREDELPALVRRAAGFHGHLGPYLVFGLRMGLLARRRLGVEGHFDLSVTALTGAETPVSCMVDGLQFSTGATLGKGNISIEPPGEDGPAAAFTAEGRTLRVRLSEAAQKLVRDMTDEESAVEAAHRAMEMGEEELFELEEGA